VPARAGGPDQTFEGIVVLFDTGGGGFRRIDADRNAEFTQEQCSVRPFLAALAALPARDEGFKPVVFGSNCR
jgi:hypothetical protein